MQWIVQKLNNCEFFLLEQQNIRKFQHQSMLFEEWFRNIEKLLLLQSFLKGFSQSW